jgi:hypothetical protein
MKVKAKPIWELTEAEFEERITPAVEDLRRETFAKGLPLSYRDKTICQADNQFIHEYGDGRKFLVEFDRHSRTEKIIRQLNG